MAPFVLEELTVTLGNPLEPGVGQALTFQQLEVKVTTAKSKAKLGVICQVASRPFAAAILPDIEIEKVWEINAHWAVQPIVTML